MAGFSTAITGTHLTRNQVWSPQLKDVFLEELQGIKYVKMVDFPDGDTLNIPSLGEFESRDYTEGQAVTYSAYDTGNFPFVIDQYKSAATYITEKAKQDMYYMNEVTSTFIPKMNRALQVAMEVKVLDVGPSGQTASSLNTINGGDHRFVASGTNAVVMPKDFARAKYALRKAHVPMTNLIAIVDPSVEFQLSTLTNLVNISYNPSWEGIVRTGATSGMRFLFSVYGFDVYTSDFLKRIPAGETINGVSVNSSAVANLFFSAASDALPFIGAVRQAPKVDSEYNKDYQREEHVVTCRYGFKLFRPENLVTVLSATDQVL